MALSRLSEEIRKKSVQDSGENSNDDDLEVSESNPFYGAIKIASTLFSLELRFKDGTSKGPKYSYIMDTDFSPSDGITIITTTRKFKITGRNLNTLYQRLLDHRIKFIQANKGADLTKETELFVDDIMEEKLML